MCVVGSEALVQHHHIPYMSARLTSSPLVVVAFQSGARANGGLESLVRIIEALPREVTVLTDREGDVAERARRAGREVHVWSVAPVNPHEHLDWLEGRLARAPALGWFNERVHRLVRSRGARVVLANDIRSFWHAAPGARASGARVIFTVRDMFPVDRPYGPKWRLTRHLADVIVTLSDSMRTETLERVRPYASAGAPVERIYSIVDDVASAPSQLDEKRELRTRLNLPVEGPLFVVVGSFCDKKNQLDLIRRAATELLAANSDGTLAFVGDFEPEADAYARKCLEAADSARGGRDRVRFVGFSRDVRAYYRAATATCVASRYEGLARSMIESLAMGTPVVSFDVTSAREILVARETGLVRPQGDYRGLVADLNRLAREPALRERLAANGIAAARQLFGADTAIQQWERILTMAERR